MTLMEFFLLVLAVYLGNIATTINWRQQATKAAKKAAALVPAEDDDGSD